MYRNVVISEFAGPIREYLKAQFLTSPIVVGGSGGSGTRLVVQLMQEHGIFMGMRRNDSQDAMPFVLIYEKYINSYLEGKVNCSDLVEDFVSAIIEHRDNSTANSNSFWGWKNPRSIYLLPLLSELFEGMYFIHVIRNGLAMSTSTNQQQLTKHGKHIIPEAYQSLPDHEQSLILWSIVNSAAADFGLKMGGHYIMVRYEDVCENPKATMVNLMNALKLPLDDKKYLANYPEINQTFHPRPILSNVTQSITVPALTRFGYIC